MINAAKLPDAGIGFQAVCMLVDKILEVDTADFFFTLDDEFNVAGQLGLTWPAGHQWQTGGW